MNIEKFISKYTIQDIKKLEQTDPQFLALKKARKNISNKNQDLFLYLTIQCALVGYQIAWSGELWRWEFGKKITKDREILNKIREQKKCNSKRWYDFLTTSKHNKRIYNIKSNRIKKFNQTLNNEYEFSKFWNKLCELNSLIAKTMKSKEDEKTITFATKMFGYAHEIISWKQTIYPMNVQIPLDSRLTKIFEQKNTSPLQRGTKGVQKKEIKSYFQNLSQKHNIPPLHLDSILRLDYRNNFIK